MTPFWIGVLIAVGFMYFSLLFGAESYRNWFEKGVIGFFEFVTAGLVILSATLVMISTSVVIFSYRGPISLYRIIAGWVARKKSHEK